MPSYISRDDEAYHDVVKGFDTEYFKRQRMERLSARAKEWNSLYQELNWFLNQIVHEGPDDAADEANRLDNWLRNFTKTGLEEMPEYLDFGTNCQQAIPLDQLRGWLLLQRSRLTPTERAAVISAVEETSDYESIGEQLRVPWPDDELTNRDRKEKEHQGRQRDRGRIHAGWEQCEDEPDAEEHIYHEQSETSVGTENEDDNNPEEPPNSKPSDKDKRTSSRDPKAKTSRRGLCLKCGGNHETKDDMPRSQSADRDRGPKQGFSSLVFYNIQRDAEMEVTTIKHDRSLRELEDTPSKPEVPKRHDEKLPILAALEAAEQLRDLIYDATGKNIKMDTSQKTTFIFGDGNSKTCTGKATFPLNIAGVDGNLEIDILDAEAPLLIGVSVLRRLGAAIDCEKNEIYFKKLGRRAQLLSRPSGDFALTLVAEADFGF
ncbi:unnamed protein product, partial [Prorocentrum cordatum]